MYTNFATLDKYLNILSGSPEFFKFVGPTNHSSILNLVYNEDYGKFQNAIATLSANDDARLVIRMKNADERYKWVFVRMHFKEKLLVNETIIIFEMMEIENAYTGSIRNEVLCLGFKKILSYYRNMMFEYNPSDNIIKFYTIDSTTNYMMYRGDIDELAQKFIDEKMIEASYVSTFNDLIKDIKNCVNNFSYEILNSISTEGVSSTMDIVTGGAIYCNNSVMLVMGAFTNDNNRLNREEANRYEKEPMTGLLNKASIMKYAKDRINFRKDETIVIAIVDMDNFKNVNDNLGHSYGDSVIIRFSEILSSVVGDKGAVGRFGGDEFMIVFNDIPDKLDRRNYFRSIRTNVESEFKNLASGVSVTCSIGSVCCPDDGTDFNNLFLLADKCLYLAKEYGKNRYIMLDNRNKKYIHVDGCVGMERNNRVSERNEFIFEMNNTLFAEGASAVPNVISRIKDQFDLSRINIYMDDDMHLVYTTDAKMPSGDNAMYLFKNNYIGTFASNNLSILENISVIQAQSPAIYQEFSERGIYSSIQYIIKDGEGNTAGLISFELAPPGRCWHDNDISSLAVFSQVISQILLKNKHIV